jgi:hypothetical protein
VSMCAAFNQTTKQTTQENRPVPSLSRQCIATGLEERGYALAALEPYRPEDDNIPDPVSCRHAYRYTLLFIENECATFDSRSTLVHIQQVETSLGILPLCLFLSKLSPKQIQGQLHLLANNPTRRKYACGSMCTRSDARCQKPLQVCPKLSAHSQTAERR